MPGVFGLGVVVLLGATSRSFVWNLVTDPGDFVGHLRDPNSLTADFSVLPKVEKLGMPGLPNLGRVTETLYRGGEPSEEGLQQLKRIGVKVVVDLRPDKDKEGKPDESTVAWKLGFRYVSIPWQVAEPPTAGQMAEFLSLVRSDPPQNIFVHCTAGRDKTGLMVAAYRMADQGWTPGQALAEMEAYGFHHDFRHFWFYDIYDYVKQFPRLMETHPQLLRSSPEESPEVPGP